MACGQYDDELLTWPEPRCRNICPSGSPCPRSKHRRSLRERYQGLVAYCRKKTRYGRYQTSDRTRFQVSHRALSRNVASRCSHDPSSARARNIGLTVLTGSSRRSRLRVDESIGHARSACRSRSRRRVSTVGLGLRLKGGRGSYGVHSRHVEVGWLFLLFGRDDFGGTKLVIDESRSICIDWKWESCSM
jgi:hypothetical protein